jgi:hypothetical protein
MKLIDIKPIIFENSADDTYADPKLPAAGPELIALLERRRHGLNVQRIHIDDRRGNMVRNALQDVQRGVCYRASYPGGFTQAREDRDAGKVIIFHIDERSKRRGAYWETFVALNTPENQQLVRQVDEANYRIGQLNQTILKLQEKISRTRRTMEKR